jgi:hypothetical protein
MGQSYAQNFPKPSRPKAEAMTLPASATRQICNNPTARRANQLRIFARDTGAVGRSSDRKRAHAKTHLLSRVNEITPLAGRARNFLFPKIRNRAFYAGPALMRGALRDRHERGGRDAVGASGCSVI